MLLSTEVVVLGYFAREALTLYLLYYIMQLLKVNTCAILEVCKRILPDYKWVTTSSSKLVSWKGYRDQGILELSYYFSQSLIISEKSKEQTKVITYTIPLDTICLSKLIGLYLVDFKS